MQEYLSRTTKPRENERKTGDLNNGVLERSEHKDFSATSNTWQNAQLLQKMSESVTRLQ